LVRITTESRELSAVARVLWFFHSAVL
jgi:hypothetical protein